MGIGNCWYSVQNSTGAFIVSNTSLSECSNSTFDVTGGGSYTLNLYSNDSFGNLNSSSVTFAVTLDGPVIVLNSPSDNSWFLNGTNLDFNFTANDATTITNCSVYTNSTGSWALNKTITSITLGVPVTTNLNFSDNSFYVWNVRCYDDSNYNQFALNNRTLGIDNIAPSIENLSVTTTSGSKTISFMSNESDNLKLKDCFYTIYDSTQSVDGSNDNVTFSCNSKVSATVTDYGNYNLTVYTEDYVGNLNSTETNFTTVAPAPTSPASSGGSGGGGGGGVPVTTKTVSVTKSFPFIQSGAPAVMDINSNTTGIEFSRISITTNRTLVNSAVTVSESNVSTSDLQIAGPGATYQSFKINTSVLNDSNIRNVSFAFRVNKSWLTANLLDVSSVVLYRNPGTGWAPVATTLVNQDSLYYYFDSSSPGFSDYAIFAGQAVPCNFGDLRCTLNESQICSVNKFWVDNQNCLGGCLDGKCVSQSQTISSTTQGLFERAKSFFNSITPAFFRAGSWGYLFYYLLLIMIVLGIIVVSFLIFKTVSSKTSKNILKEVNNKDNSFKA